MTDEETKKEEVKPLSPIEETRKLLDEIKKEKEEITQERKRLEELRSEQLLSSTAGGQVETPKPVEETPQEYAKRAITGGLNNERR